MKQQSELQTTWFKDFGGLSQSLPGDQVPIGMFQDMMNYEISRTGELSPRLGYDKKFATSTPDGQAIMSFYHANMDGILYLIVQTKLHVYAIDPDKTWNLIFTFPSETFRKISCCVINENLNPTMIFGNQDIPLQKWTSGLSSACLNAPQGRPINYKGYITVFDIKGSPGIVQFNYFGNGGSDPDMWYFDDGTGVFTYDSARYLEFQGKVTAVANFSGLVVFGTHRTMLFSGDPDSPGSMDVISSTTGCISHESIADCNGILLFMSAHGIMAWSGGGVFPDGCVSFPENMQSSNVKKWIEECQDLSKSCAVFDPVKNRYIVSILGTHEKFASQSRFTLVFDLSKKAWYVWSINKEPYSLFQEYNGKQYVIIGDSAGYIYQIETNSEPSDNGEPFEFWAETGDMNFGFPDNEKTFRAFHVGCKGVAIRKIAIDAGGDFGISGYGNSVNVSIGGFVLDSSRLAENDTSAYGSPLGSITEQTRYMANSGEIGTAKEINLDPGGFGLDSSIIGGQSHILSNPRPYIVEREPMTLRTKNIRLRIKGKLVRAEDGLPMAFYSIPISTIGLEWKLGVKRPLLIGSKSPILNFRAFDTYVGTLTTFSNLSSSTYYVYRFEWWIKSTLRHGFTLAQSVFESHLDVDELSNDEFADGEWHLVTYKESGDPDENIKNGKPSELVYTFSEPGEYHIMLKAFGYWRTSTRQNVNELEVKKIIKKVVVSL